MLGLGEKEEHTLPDTENVECLYKENHEALADFMSFNLS